MESFFASDSCIDDSYCPYQYYCEQSSLLCEHYPIFPLRLVPSLIYLVIPLSISICNIGGLSGGAFKILIFMDMLNYPVTKATTLIYPVITGGAFANFISLLLQRNPETNGPL